MTTTNVPATDQDLFDLECGGKASNPPASPTYIQARRRIYELGVAHGQEAARVLTPEVLEKAARAAYEEDHCDAMTPWDQGSDTWRNDWRALTKSALLAVGFTEPEPEAK